MFSKGLLKRRNNLFITITYFYHWQKMCPGPKSFPQSRHLTSGSRPRAKRQVSRPSNIDLSTLLSCNPGM